MGIIEIRHGWSFAFDQFGNFALFGDGAATSVGLVVILFAQG